MNPATLPSVPGGSALLSLILFAVVAGGCDARTQAAPRELRGRAAGTEAAASAPVSFAVDPDVALGPEDAEPKLVPGPGAPTQLHSMRLRVKGGFYDAHPFRRPSTSHADGTFVGLDYNASSKQYHLSEVDVHTLRAVHSVVLPPGLSEPRVIATPTRVVALAICDECDPHRDASRLFFFDQDLELIRTHTIRQQWLEAATEGSTMVTFGFARNGTDGSGGLTAWNLEEATVRATMSVPRYMSTDYPGSRVMATTRGKVFFVAPDAHAGLALFSVSQALKPPMSKRKIPIGPAYRPLQFAKGITPTSGGVLLSLEGENRIFTDELALITKSEDTTEATCGAIAIDPGTGRVLHASGEGQASLRKPVKRWVQMPQRKNSFHGNPYRAFFHASRGIIFTKFPVPRVTVLRWGD